MKDNVFSTEDCDDCQLPTYEGRGTKDEGRGTKDVDCGLTLFHAIYFNI